MPKRKRHQPEVPQHGGPRPSDAEDFQKQQVEAKIVHGIKLLNRALRTAKGFERQKLGKRQKAAKAKDDSAELVRLDAEIEALKNLECPVIAETHLIKTLLKSKTTSLSHLLPAHRVPDVRATSKAQGPATMNVIARLYNSNPVKDSLKDVINAIRTAMGIEDTICTSKGHTGAPPSGEEQSEHLDFSVPKEPAKEDDEEQPPNYTRLGTRSLATLGSKEREDGISDSPEGSDHNKYNSRIVVSIDEAFETGDALPSNYHVATCPYHHSQNLSLSPSPSRSPSTPPPSKVRPREAHVTVKGSTFIPSLMGGYWSGSESGDEDIEPVELAPRKNRRGQQARRAIWEKKYGTKAKHLQGQSRDQGWDSRSGAMSNTRGRAAPERSQASGANTDPIKARPIAQKDDEGSLHPSWIAAKKAKEQKQTAPFQGKKVVFD